MLTTDLEYFLRIAETGSLRRAALLCDVSQPAVTKGLRRLEAELGLTLVERSSKGAALTEVGRAFLDRASRLVRDVDAALQEANELRAGVMGLVRIGITPALVVPIFQTACTTLMRQRPTSRYRVRIGLSDELLTALRRGEIDLMISGVPEVDSDEILVRIIGENTLQVVARAQHPVFRKRRPKLADVASCEWVLPRRGVLSRDWLDRVFVSNDLPRPTVRVEFEPSHDGLLPMLLEADLLSVAGESVSRSLKGTGLEVVDIAALQWRRPIAVMTRAQAALSPIVRRFIELLEGHAAQATAPAADPPQPAPSASEHARHA